MNKLLLILVVFIGLLVPRSYSQTQTVDERFIEAMSALDMTPVTSGTGIF
ncbi:MAG: hypothetical protein LC107_05175 [Chitinophagales bacterium]|nr:hypothetical protein [Chitinophagales bacterium]